MNETLVQAAALIPALIFAIVFHEVAHGYVAKLLGDPTAEERNRLTLNPLRHVDLIGTVILPGMLALAKLPVLGWAKPVPVDKWRLRNPRVGMMLVAAAGPGSNLVMAALAAVLLGALVRAYAGLQMPDGLAAFIGEMLKLFIQFNVFLAFFNLLPIPPFDGSHIVEGLLPRSMAHGYGRLRRFGMMLVLFLLVVLPAIAPGRIDIIGRFVLPPVMWMLAQYGGLVALVAGTAPALT